MNIAYNIENVETSDLFLTISTETFTTFYCICAAACERIPDVDLRLKL